MNSLFAIAALSGLAFLLSACGPTVPRIPLRLELKLPKSLAKGTGQRARLQRRVSHIEIDLESREGEKVNSAVPPEAWDATQPVTEIGFPRGEHDSLTVNARVWGKRAEAGTLVTLLEGKKTVSAKEVGEKNGEIVVELHLRNDD